VNDKESPPLPTATTTTGTIITTMALSRKTQRQASIAAVSGLLVVGAAALFFKTFPHLNPFSNANALDSDVAAQEEDKKNTDADSETAPLSTGSEESEAAEVVEAVEGQS
jgi:hypothetical protein